MHFPQACNPLRTQGPGVQEHPGAGLRDGTEIADRDHLGHTDVRVCGGDGGEIRVALDLDLQVLGAALAL